MLSMQIVAHSIGRMIGKAACKTLLQRHKQELSIMLFALSTPFSYVPFLYDTSLYKFYNCYNVCNANNDNVSNSNIIHTSAGTKDELMHPSWCELHQKNIE